MSVKFSVDTDNTDIDLIYEFNGSTWEMIDLIEGTYEAIGAYFMSYWVTKASGMAQINGTLLFDTTSVTVNWNVNLLDQ